MEALAVVTGLSLGVSTMFVLCKAVGLIAVSWWWLALLMLPAVASGIVVAIFLSALASDS